MNIELIPVDASEKPRLLNLLQFYAYDCSSIDADDPEVNGLFYLDEELVDDYWKLPGWSARFVVVDALVVGFVLIEVHALLEPGAKELADIFILKRHRGRGIGTEIVRKILLPESGAWEIYVCNGDVEAEKFWRSCLPKLALKNIRYLNGLDEWEGPVFKVLV